MGRYIQTSAPKGKAKEIVEKHNGVMVLQPASLAEVDEDVALIVVVDNGPFEAAAYAYTQREFEAFTDPTDFRPKQFVLIPKVVAEQLAG